MKINISRIKTIDKLKQQIKICNNEINKDPEEFMRALGQILYQTEWDFLPTEKINEISTLIDNILEITVDEKLSNKKLFEDVFKKIKDTYKNLFNRVY